MCYPFQSLDYPKEHVQAWAGCTKQLMGIIYYGNYNQHPSITKKYFCRTRDDFNLLGNFSHTDPIGRSINQSINYFCYREVIAQNDFIGLCTRVPFCLSGRLCLSTHAQRQQHTHARASFIHLFQGCKNQSFIFPAGSSMKFSSIKIYNFFQTTNK